MLRTTLIVAACAALGACTTIDAGKDHVSATYFGIVRVVTPVTDANAAAAGATMTALDTHVVGLQIQGGVGLGYIHDQRYAMPTDCRVVIFVQNQAQLDQLAHQFADFKEGICSTIKPS
ncbi:MAG TPA: hypothetical protein VNU97_19270 [Rhizomicrobium sp.]|jgi:hypothetical protein|nr:hypothetical protein [Rhizomicrobium sp.]